MGDTPHVLYLANSIIGVSVLTIPYCFKQCGIFLGVFALWLVGLLTKTVCHHLIKASILARRRNYEMLAYHTFGIAGKSIVEVCIIGYLMGCCVAFFVVIGDLTPEILGNTFGFNSSKPWIRNAVMIGSAIFFAYPLSLLRDIRSLGGICSASIGFYFLLIFKILLEAAPKMNKLSSETTMWKSSGFLQVIPIFSMAQSCQTQVFEVYDSLPEPSLKHMDIVVSRAVNLCTFVYIATGILGYIAFGELTTGNAVMDLQPSMFTEIIKFGFVLSILVSFPLLIFPCRSSLYSMLYGKATVSLHDPAAATFMPETRFRVLTALVLLVTLLVGLAVPNIEFVLGLVGATIGTMVCVIIPSMLLLQVVQDGHQSRDRQKAQVVLVIGITILIFGTYYSLYPEDSKVEIAIPAKTSDLLYDHQFSVGLSKQEEQKPKEPDLKFDPGVANLPALDTRFEPALPFERDGGAPIDTEEIQNEIKKDEPPKEPAPVKAKLKNPAEEGLEARKIAEVAVEEIIEQPAKKDEVLPVKKQEAAQVRNILEAIPVDTGKMLVPQTVPEGPPAVKIDKESDGKENKSQENLIVKMVKANLDLNIGNKQENLPDKESRQAEVNQEQLKKGDVPDQNNIIEVKKEEVKREVQVDEAVKVIHYEVNKIQDNIPKGVPIEIENRIPVNISSKTQNVVHSLMDNSPVMRKEAVVQLPVDSKISDGVKSGGHDDFLQENRDAPKSLSDNNKPVDLSNGTVESVQFQNHTTLQNRLLKEEV